MGAEGGTMRFPVGQVRRHAGTVDQVGDGVELARSAVHEVTMHPQAYGQLCRFLPALLSPVFGLAVDALHEATDSLRETAVNLRTAATSTQAADVRSARNLHDAGHQHRPRLDLPL